MRKLSVVALLVLSAPSSMRAQWTYMASGTSADLRGLSVVSERVAWASGARGAVIRSIDGGRSWMADGVVAFSQLDFRAIRAFDDRAALIASAGEPAASSPAVYLSSVACAGADKLVAVGIAGTFVSRDGGQRWTQTDTIPLNAVRFSGRTGIAVGPHGRVARADGVE